MSESKIVVIPTSVADRLFEADYALRRLEDEAHREVCRALGIDYDDVAAWGHDDFTYDPYDSSYELKGVRADWTPTPEQIRATFALGFDRCWICYVDGTEAHYSKSDPRPETEWGNRKERVR